MDLINLQTPFLDGGLRSINFFNGRLLSGEDLNQEKAANREHQRQLGRALGDGVAYGLAVSETTGISTASAPVVTVQPGLAINREGQTISLSTSAKVSLLTPASSNAPAAGGLFADCKPPQGGSYIAGAGVYLLTIAPAEGSEGRAPVSGLGNIAAACNTRYQIEGVQFRLIELSHYFTSELQEPARLRNRVAHRCFGTDDPDLTAALANPFGPPVTQYGLLDDLRPTCLTDREVPLAVLYWTTAGLQFIDMWAVRRRVTQPASATQWPLLVADRRAAEGEAMFQQFQTQITSVFDSGFSPTSMKAKAHFRYLPAVGIVPLANARFANGFNEALFFEGITRRETLYIENARCEFLLRTSFAYPPLDLDSGVMMWVYRVRENSEAIFQNSTNPPQPYLVFASGHMPYLGDAHYDVNRWGYSNVS